MIALVLVGALVGVDGGNLAEFYSDRDNVLRSYVDARGRRWQLTADGGYEPAYVISNSSKFELREYDRLLVISDTNMVTRSYLDREGRFFVRSPDGGFVELLTLTEPDGGWTIEALQQLAPSCREPVPAPTPQGSGDHFMILFVAALIVLIIREIAFFMRTRR